MRMPRITTRRLMVWVAIAALILWPVHCSRQVPVYERQADLHDLLAGICENEAARMRRRADACLDRARSDAPWDDPGEPAAGLKDSPYPSDVPRIGSWAEQAAIWERASRRAEAAAAWHGSMVVYYGGWSLVRPVGPRVLRPSETPARPASLRPAGDRRARPGGL